MDLGGVTPLDDEAVDGGSVAQGGRGLGGIDELGGHRLRVGVREEPHPRESTREKIGEAGSLRLGDGHEESGDELDDFVFRVSTVCRHEYQIGRVASTEAERARRQEAICRLCRMAEKVREWDGIVMPGGHTSILVQKSFGWH